MKKVHILLRFFIGPLDRLQAVLDKSIDGPAMDFGKWIKFLVGKSVEGCQVMVLKMLDEFSCYLVG